MLGLLSKNTKISQDANICIYGAGKLGSKCRKFIEGILYRSVYCYSDTSLQKIGTVCEGIEVFSLEKISSIPNVCVVVAIDSLFQTLKVCIQLKLHGIRNILICRKKVIEKCVVPFPDVFITKNSGNKQPDQKFALMRSNVVNIGDDIQYISNLRFLPQIDYFMESKRTKPYGGGKQK